MEDIFTLLNDRQIEAVQHDKGPLLILAGAGSGKTRVLTHRIAYLIEENGVSPYSILAVTFTNKAAGEMKERVQKLVGHGAENIWVSTFHSTCVRILRRFVDNIGFGRDFTIYDADDQKSLMRDICKSLGIDTKRIKEKTILSVISSAKDELIDPELFEQQAGGSPQEKKYAQCYHEYQKRLRLSNAMDFDDLIFKTIELFRACPDVLDYYRRRFTYIMVDEYQDTNSAQFELIRLLASHENEYGETEHNLCVVGDDDQSIYKFRGANIRNILDFEKCYPDAKVIRLEQNYRSTKSILDVANGVIHNNVGRKDKTLWTRNGDGTPVNYVCLPNDSEEASFVIGQIWAAVREGICSYKDYAILYRTNAQSRSFEEKLVYRNIPYRIVGGQNFYQRREIKDILAYLKTVASGKDTVSLKRIINVPKRGIGAASIERIDAYAGEHEISFFEALERAPFIDGIGRAVSKINSFMSLIGTLKADAAAGKGIVELIDEIIEYTEYESYLGDEDEPDKVRERMENIDELKSKAAAYEDECDDMGEKAELGGFLDEVSLVADIDDVDESDDKVLLMTIHSAKGLEFSNVFLVGMEEGLFPGYMAINSDSPSEDIEEERRLCYVGITRARENLTLTSAQQRMTRGELQFNAVSRFVKEIPRYMLKMSGAPAPRRLSDSDTSFLSGRRETTGGGSVAGIRNTGAGSRGADRGRSEGYGQAVGAGKKGTAASEAHRLLSDNPYIRQGITAAADMPDGPGYEVGDSVSHIKFGVGRVLEIVKGTKDYEVTVEFPGGTRRLLASFAKLKKV